MIKAVVVTNNIVKKVVVTKDLSDVKIFGDEEIKVYPKNRKIKSGDKYDGVFKRMLKKMGMK
jgi:hypothetical protein